MVHESRRRSTATVDWQIAPGREVFNRGTDARWANVESVQTLPAWLAVRQDGGKGRAAKPRPGAPSSAVIGGLTDTSAYVLTFVLPPRLAQGLLAGIGYPD